MGAPCAEEEDLNNTVSDEANLANKPGFGLLL